MATLLRIDSSASGDASKSRQLTDNFVEQWLAKNPEGQVVTRDVNANPLPHFTSETLGALFTAEEDRTDEQKAIVSIGDELIEEIENADVVAVSAPMYNFGIPSTLKSYFDYIARAGRTFQYTENGPKGLLDKDAYIFAASGSFLADSPVDHQVPHIQTFLGFVGLNVKETFIAGGQAMGEAGEEAFAKAKEQIAAAV
ncbi:FMN-dependent NADH-azoreductase [Marinomonas mediterranea]|jgi:Acyl carrier protein phosphodiesterase|uniref:FMN dependent NADH:quinone oxidoreductase n=1 Tax=Marinomonas mediterranea (strain ATCC 700492 / JCM 21426 / NBRC 103028 / MMB-1) TaxID=717774 RepID=F2K138_MARM1|nr:NAD(P)H-dependent oxidoreductase [Marinomonas mediterranea]ADZ89888.1 FMN-dependent NADH-azoreductase [Marinomonas mediterranea MMB-1]WCN07973.1 FMN-dependent NADH-azoreductase [Marinomonas mediterranea]WCN12068.1 FMN-dependent NADH-azoreductase [Marinomonas mediterranea]WCN16106.1 FMN-dependent NADH-azoreductase [Marinomonas mediterranea MMB-1]